MRGWRVAQGTEAAEMVPRDIAVPQPGHAREPLAALDSRASTGKAWLDLRP